MAIMFSSSAFAYTPFINYCRNKRNRMCVSDFVLFNIDDYPAFHASNHRAFPLRCPAQKQTANPRLEIGGWNLLGFIRADLPSS